MPDFQAMQEALIACEQDNLVALVNDALSQQTPASDILNQGLIAGMDIVGSKMESGDMFIPEVLMATQCMTTCVNILKPLLGDAASQNSGTVLIGTVKGDLHDIGKNLVAMMMESAGMVVHNIGVDVEPAKFVQEIKEKNPDVVCLSALLTTTMPMMKKTIDIITDSGLRSQVKIVVGGAPVTEDFANQIGADGFAPDAGSASRLVKSLAH